MRTHHPLPGPEACATCRHFEVVGDHPVPFGACRCHAPVLIPDAYPDVSGEWPTVYADARCGEFARAYTPPLGS